MAPRTLATRLLQPCHRLHFNFVLFLIDSTPPGPAWFYVPLTGWGLLLRLHALHAYEMLSWTDQDWPRRKVQDLVDSRPRR